MLDKESEIYHSGLINREAQAEYGALVITREGIEISAASKGFRFEYSSSWDRIRANMARVDQRLTRSGVRPSSVVPRTAFVQRGSEETRGN